MKSQIDIEKTAVDGSMKGKFIKKEYGFRKILEEEGIDYLEVE